MYSNKVYFTALFQQRPEVVHGLSLLITPDRHLSNVVFTLFILHFFQVLQLPLCGCMKFNTYYIYLFIHSKKIAVVCGGKNNVIAPPMLDKRLAVVFIK